MMRYSIGPRDFIIKGYGFLSLAKKMSKNFGNDIRKNLSTKYSQKLLDHAEKSATDAIKTASKRAIPKTVEVTGDIIGNKIADKTTKASKSLPQNSSETVETETENIGFDR